MNDLRVRMINDQPDFRAFFMFILRLQSRFVCTLQDLEILKTILNHQYELDSSSELFKYISKIHTSENGYENEDIIYESISKMINFIDGELENMT